VIAICPDLPGSAEYAIHRARYADGQALNAPDESVPMGRFDEHVDMVALYGEVADAEVRALRMADAIPNGAEDAYPAEAREAVSRAKRDVRRMRRVVPRTDHVRDARPRAVRLTARSRAPAAAGRGNGKQELLRDSHDSARLPGGDEETSEPIGERRENRASVV
jgi:hypothetical protein